MTLSMVSFELLSSNPRNASLKNLCWKLGESFVKVSGSEDAFYGQEYAKRKKFEIDRNEQGYYKDHAKLVQHIWLVGMNQNR